MNVFLVGAFVISSQILVLQAEIMALGEKCGVSEDSDSEIVDNMSVHSEPGFESSGDAPEPKIDAKRSAVYVTSSRTRILRERSSSKHFKTFCATLTQMAAMLIRTKRISPSHPKSVLMKAC